MFKPSSVLCSAFLKRFHLSLRFKSRWCRLKQRSAIARKLSSSESNRTFFCVFIGSEGILLLLSFFLSFYLSFFLSFFLFFLSFFLKETIAIYLLRLRSNLLVNVRYNNLLVNVRNTREYPVITSSYSLKLTEGNAGSENVFEFESLFVRLLVSRWSQFKLICRFYFMMDSEGTICFYPCIL